ncbi:MAG: hypothetical protein F6K28_35735, partial [Microcoleus sp. SIO2G3]|nr:hypothetical protein [Microcoleus sp. SIO2G3]
MNWFFKIGQLHKDKLRPETAIPILQTPATHSTPELHPQSSFRNSELRITNSEFGLAAIAHSALRQKLYSPALLKTDVLFVAALHLRDRSPSSPPCLENASLIYKRSPKNTSATTACTPAKWPPSNR